MGEIVTHTFYKEPIPFKKTIRSILCLTGHVK